MRKTGQTAEFKWWHGKIAAYKVPKSVDFIGEKDMPLTATRKSATGFSGNVTGHGVRDREKPSLFLPQIIPQTVCVVYLPLVKH